ncbi:E3 ubiquitin ligase BIG BROTHER-related-like [Juglans microcarpa x Juglans regia]|uniref:E3 ubiquitin ligase BIG BROTHER-related-like n=1 Tax=Juglans microcarpa x Juglans regia TaxID=2249226 RepID=UPI001B7DCD14|nr:E3 ubiquitin ligase BIG BROTHER-related-like [Juglans microcarpa x Juglans regia]
MRSSTSMMNQQRAEVDAEMEGNAVTATTYYNLQRLMRLYTERPQRTLASPIIQVLRQENPSLDSMLNTLLETGEVDTQSQDLYVREDETQSQGLSHDQISLLPISKYECDFISGKDSGDERCVICQMEYKRGEQQMTLPCKHVYHATCGTKWLNINKACPLCQTKVFFDVSKDKA